MQSGQHCELLIIFKSQCPRVWHQGSHQFTQAPRNMEKIKKFFSLWVSVKKLNKACYLFL